MGRYQSLKFGKKKRFTDLKTWYALYVHIVGGLKYIIRSFKWNILFELWTLI